MKEKKEELWQLMLEMTFDDKATYEKVMGAVNEATGEHGYVSSIGYGKVKGFDVKSGDKKPEVFQPQKDDICTCVIEGNVDAIFRYDGKTRTDEDGTVWLDGDLGLTWSGDLFHPYMVIHGEDAEYHRDCCRPATDEEKELFYEKTKKFRAEEKEEKKWEVGDWVFVISSESGCSKVFFPVPVTYADTKIMGNLVRRGWVFDKEEDCEAFCDKLNEAIKNVK